MNALQKYFSYIGILFTIGLVLFLHTSTQANLEFSDIGGREDTKAIEFLKENSIVQGYENNEYKPEQHISRAEFLKILLETAVAKKNECTATEQKNIQNIFSDVSPEEWYAEYVCTGYNSGFIKGYPDKTFRPQQEISLAEAAKIVALVQELDIDSDVESKEWFAPFLKTLNNQKALREKSQETPDQKISRGDMADLIWRVSTGNEIFENDEIQTIHSCEELKNQIQKADKRSGNFSFQGNLVRQGVEIMENEIMFDAVAPTAMQKSVSNLSVSESTGSGESSASNDFSTTNIQEKGVDEADSIKNDGSHIFSARGEDIKIVRAYPISEMKEEAEIVVKGMNITELFLDGDTLIALGNSYNTTSNPPITPYLSKRIAVSECINCGYSHNRTIEVRIFDISDRSNPEQIRSISLDGNLVSSRRVGETLYLVANNFFNYRTFSPDALPLLRETTQAENQTNTSSIAVLGDKKCGNIQYFPNFTNSNLTTIVAVDTKNPSQEITLKNFLGAGNNIYASPKNLYVVQGSSEQIFDDENGVASWRWENFSKISRISLDGLQVKLEAQGKVLGSVLNQYSMSEFENHFRIATQKGAAWGREKSENLVTILDEHLKKTGEIRNIANGESIKSARFMGKRGFLVTFKTVDPLFVLDLNPTNPQILGKLKIPGWSDYLHPINDDYLIGFGKEVDESIDADKVHSENAVYYTAVQGMKISIFDVSDLNNPKEIHKTVIGDRGTSSEILQNPRALFYDAKRQLLGFPISIQKKSLLENGSETFKNIFSGAQIYNFSIENGFSKLGEVSHLPATSTNTWDQNYKITRILRIGENFYSSSKGLITGLSAEMEKENEVSFLKNIPCEKITDPLQCSQSQNNCKALYSEPECPEGQFCIQVMQFDKCVSK